MARVTIILILSICFGFYAAASAGLDWKHLNLSCNGSNVQSLNTLLHTVSRKTAVTLSNCTFVLTSPLTISDVQGLISLEMTQ